MAKPSIFGADALRRYIEKCNMPYFKIIMSETEAGRGSALASNYDKENQTVADVRRDVDEYLDTIRHRGGDFIIWLAGKPKASLPEYRSLVEIPPEHLSGISGIGNPYSVGAPQNIEEMISKGIAQGMERFTMEQKIRELEKERDDYKQQLKDNEPGVLERIATRVEPFIEPVIGAIFQQKKTVAIGSGKRKEGNDEALDEEEQKRAEQALNKLYELEPDATLILEGIVKLAVENIELFKTAKSFIGL